MAVRIRLTRMGAKKRPFYRFVVADSRAPRDGRFIEILGYYNPIADSAELVVDKEKALEWMTKGAQPSERVKTLFRKQECCLIRKRSENERKWLLAGTRRIAGEVFGRSGTEDVSVGEDGGTPVQFLFRGQ